MLVECKNCGAPLDVEGNATFVECQFCQQTNKVASTRTLMAATPANWQAPTQWTEADREAARKVLLATAGATAATGGSGCIIAAVIMVATLVVGGVITAIVLRKVEQAVGSVPGTPFGMTAPPSWDGTVPFSCGGNDQVTIDGVTANLPNDVAITVTANCALTITNSTINARVGVDADGNRAVRLHSSVVSATATGIFLNGNKQLVLDQSDVIAGGVGVQASGNAQIQLNGGKIEGSPSVATSGNARLQNQGGNLIDR